MLLALRGGGSVGVGSGECCVDLLAVRGIRRGEQKVAFEAVRHDEVGIGDQRAADQGHRVDVVFQIVLDGAVEQGRRFRAVGR